MAEEDPKPLAMIEDTSNEPKLANKSNDNSTDEPEINNESKAKVKDRQYSVEKIVKKRVRGNKVQYLLKWQGYSDAENTWEDEDNLTDCQSLLKEFNSKVETEPTIEKPSKKRSAKEMDPSGKKNDPSAKRARKMKEEVGFDYGDKVQDIVGARMIKNVLHLYVQWKVKNVCSFVPAEICNKKIPQKVIEFYEGRIKFEKPLDIAT